MDAEVQKRGKQRRPLVASYQNRNDRLSELGMTYQQYLACPEWQVIRKIVLAESPLCLICHNKACQVHHTDYEWDTLLGTCRDGLASLCDGCHELIEFDGKRKRTLQEANDLLQSLVLKTSEWLKRFLHRKKTAKQRERQLQTNANKQEKQLKIRVKIARHNRARKKKKPIPPLPPNPVKQPQTKKQQTRIERMASNTRRRQRFRLAGMQ